MAKQLPLQFAYRADQRFEDFLAAANNAIVHHLKQCVMGTGDPLIYLWGKPGTGKSHLLQACCHLAHSQDRPNFYCDLAQPGIDPAKIFESLETSELVCLDSIDTVAGCSSAELSLFNFFNRHRDLGHKLIVASRVSPPSLPISLPDLQTRLRWGLVLNLKLEDDAARLAILMFRAKRRGLTLSTQAGRFLLKRAGDDLAELWHLLDLLDQASLSAKRKPTIPFLQQILNENGR